MEQVIGHDPLLVRAARLSGRGPDFSPAVTKDLWAELSDDERRCSEDLLKAQLKAHRGNRTDSAKSFRNCSIIPGAEWIEQQLERFREAMDVGRRDEATEALGEAIAALHSFYAYTNYVELLDRTGRDWDEVADHAHEVWRDPKGDLEDTSQLKSDYNPGVEPNLCSRPLPHLNKSTRATPPGKVMLANFGLTAHAAAVDLALRDTKALLRAAYRERPDYGTPCGSTSLFAWMVEGWSE